MDRSLITYLLVVAYILHCICRIVSVLTFCNCPEVRNSLEVAAYNCDQTVPFEAQRLVGTLVVGRIPRTVGREEDVDRMKEETSVVAWGIDHTDFLTAQSPYLVQRYMLKKQR